MALKALDLTLSGPPAWAPASAGQGRRRRSWYRGITVSGLLKLSLVVILSGQLGRVPLIMAGAKEAPFLLNDLVLLIALVGGFHLILQRRRFLLDWTSTLALSFAAVGGISAFLAVPRFGLSGFQLAFSLAYLARWSAYFGLYLLVLNFVERKDVEGLWRVLEGTVLAFAVFGILQSLFLPGFAQMVYPEAELYTQWDPQGRRLVSTFLDPNLAGALLVMVLAVQGGRLAFGVPVALWKPLLLFGALGLTLSRSSLLALVAGAGVILLVRGLSRRVLKVTGVLSLLILPLVPVLVSLALTYNKFNLADPSLLARFVSWERALIVFLDHPILGVGFNTYGFVQLKYGFDELLMATFGLDGGVIFIAVMTGGLGLAIYLAMVGRVVLESSRVWKNRALPSADRGLALGVVAATAALLVHSLFLNSILYPFLMHVLWVIWGMVAVTYRACASR
ncbi:O-antigen ligase family protein [Gemmatimonadota bacterium]